MTTLAGAALVALSSAMSLQSLDFAEQNSSHEAHKLIVNIDVNRDCSKL